MRKGPSFFHFYHKTFVKREPGYQYRWYNCGVSIFCAVSTSDEAVFRLADSKLVLMLYNGSSISGGTVTEMLLHLKTLEEPRKMKNKTLATMLASRLLLQSGRIWLMRRSSLTSSLCRGC